MLELDVLVIGAGISGLVAATELQKSGISVACVEKARGSGGRLSSKRIASSTAHKMISFDLGCASFDAQTELFRSHVEQWVSQGVAKRWRYSASEGTHYVGVPRNSSITRYLADQLDVHFSTRITEIKKIDGYWQASTGETVKTVFAKAKHILFATPPQQAADLLPTGHEFKTALSQPILKPQWVLMLYVKGSLDMAGDYRNLDGSIISRMVLEQGKPDREEHSDHQVWVIHADAGWTAQNLEVDKDLIVNQLLTELASITGSPVIIEDTYLHRWLYSVAQHSEQTDKSYRSDGNGLWLCGDYLANTSLLRGVEAAFISGYHIAKNFKL